MLWAALPAPASSSDVGRRGQGARLWRVRVGVDLEFGVERVGGVQRVKVTREIVLEDNDDNDRPPRRPCIQAPPLTRFRKPTALTQRGLLSRPEAIRGDQVVCRLQRADFAQRAAGRLQSRIERAARTGWRSSSLGGR